MKLHSSLTPRGRLGSHIRSTHCFLSAILNVPALWESGTLYVLKMVSPTCLHAWRAALVHLDLEKTCCVTASPPVSGSLSVSLGQCPRSAACSRSFTTYMAVSVLSSFINSLGTTPGYMVIIRCITPELKSLALGIQTMVMRTLGGIPAPVYFGALIDLTCLKWGLKKSGGRGACRMYDSDMYRVIFLGLITCLSGSSYFFAAAVIVLLRRQFQSEDDNTGDPPTKKDGLELHPTHTVEEADKTENKTKGQF
ncbi:hypothetical protein GJAV_G00160600 [Gymnothorax javanicus]|nr:hypothetical protein GJAV_G00160600 [Gymnothorax javanicus]